jgi:hypothetical protein
MKTYLGVVDTNGKILRDVTDSNGLPVVLTGRNAKTIQTHNAVSVPLSGNSLQSSWMDLSGYYEISVNMLNDAGAVCSADLYWSTDGINIQGTDQNIVASSSKSYGSGNTKIKARYAKVRVVNGDAGAAHTMSAWVYLTT